MEDSRIRQIMKDLGSEHSQSLKIAIDQIINEVFQEIHDKYKEKLKLGEEAMMELRKMQDKEFDRKTPRTPSGGKLFL